VIAQFEKDQNAATQLAVGNVNNHASAYSQITAASNAGGANYVTLISAPPLGEVLTVVGLSGILSANAAGLFIGNTSNTPLYLGTQGAYRLTITAAGYVSLHVIHAGATQAAAGAAANEIWKTSGHATLPDNVLMIGV
jgi:hypothetical protein